MKMICITHVLCCLSLLSLMMFYDVLDIPHPSQLFFFALPFALAFGFTFSPLARSCKLKKFLASETFSESSFRASNH